VEVFQSSFVVMLNKLADHHLMAQVSVQVLVVLAHLLR